MLFLLRRGVIVGWDPECKASEEWMQQMGVDSLPGAAAKLAFAADGSCPETGVCSFCVVQSCTILAHQ